MISVVIALKNGERTLKRCLDSLTAFPEVLLADNGSTDSSLEIAASFPNVRVESFKFQGFAKLRNDAALLASNDWILSIDCDEWLPEESSKILLSLNLDESKVYGITIHNFFNGRCMKGCGWGPKIKTRLYHRKNYQYESDALVHEALIFPKGALIALKAKLFHTPYLSTYDFLRKMDLYTTLDAERHKSKKGSFSEAIFRAMGAFLRSYFLRFGFLDGLEGVVISLYNSHYNFYKVLKRVDLNI